ncbi:MAG: branched-chain alpha-keto acid dehydrogenase subunit E2, partial [Sideroxydans sp.]|nr:branched-chain alpha-keto acid dehydrogenase subunit E2 [Sideroxydans sp.]
MAEINKVQVPDIGGFKGVTVIEVAVKAGDTVEVEQTLITVETDKATMDVPAPFAGVVKEMKIKVGDKVSEGDLIALIEGGAAVAKAAAPVAAPQAAVTAPVVAPQAAAVVAPVAASPVIAAPTGGSAHASPSIRRFARELGVNLTKVGGSGEKGRVTKEDVQNFVKQSLAQPAAATGGGALPGLLPWPDVDFARFGEIESKPLSRIKKISGANLHRNWVMIPHVTQFEEADISEMEAFRKELGAEYAKQNLKITPLAFMLKACAITLKHFPDFNASLDTSGENLVLKKYIHIGVAVDTPNGLMVPVIRDVDKKGIVQLAKELGEVSAKARDLKITAADMQGGCFSISSLGGLGGT